VNGNGSKSHITLLPKWKFEYKNCEEMLKKHFHVSTLDGFGLRGKPLPIRAAGAILLYLQDTQPTALKMLTSLSTYSLDEFVALDHSTFRNLEICTSLREGTDKGSLLQVLDQTMTPMGQRMMRQWITQPLMNIKNINERYDWIGFFIQHGILRAEIRSDLKHLSDLERLVNRVISGSASPRDLTAIRITLESLPGIINLLSNKPHPETETISIELPDCSSEESLLQDAISDNPPANLQKNGIIRPGFSAELDQLIESSQHAREWISNLESVERERTGIKNLKVGFNKVFGYYIEITHSNTDAAPADYIRKQTLVNAERYITPEMKEYETLVLNAEEQIHEVELRVFRQVVAQLAASGPKLLEVSRSLAKLDVLAALAETSVSNNYVRPVITDDNSLEIINARHPVVEQSLAEKRFIPNDIVLEPGEIIRIITGPNMSGKSTFLRQAALIVLMAQMGSFIPAEKAKIGIVDRIFTRIGAQDEIHAGQSTFMVEMVETANILNNATHRSLLILDEIGRGTSTYDGVSIAWAVVEYIHNHPKLKARTLFATHYHELMQLSQILPGVRNYNVAVTESENNVVFLHKIVQGGSDRSYGIHVGELAGLPQPVIHRAVEILKNLESTSGKTNRSIHDVSFQMNLFPETNPLLSEIDSLDLNSTSPIQALTILYEWKKRFGNSEQSDR
ncbi:MAG: DNA mismatch repair protein MutS, partial [Chloroflexi bacterium]|nr:DNA mismatch repair protein MutS [Chloroflexota bacterium]